MELHLLVNKNKAVATALFFLRSIINNQGFALTFPGKNPVLSDRMGTTRSSRLQRSKRSHQCNAHSYYQRSMCCRYEEDPGASWFLSSLKWWLLGRADSKN